MIETPRVTDADEQHAAVIRFTIPRAEMRHVMGGAIAELLSTLTAEGLAPAGPLFTHHLRMTPEIFDFEVGFPVPGPITGSGRVTPGVLPGDQVVRTVYHGDYEGLGAAWGELDRWIRQNGHIPAGHLWERYLVGPEAGSDPAQWRTELNRPLAE